MTDRPYFVTDEHLEYLDNLRDSGVCNMYGAAEYLEDEFVLSRSDSRKILRHWMDSFDERHPEGS